MALALSPKASALVLLQTGTQSYDCRSASTSKQILKTEPFDTANSKRELSA